ncbi:hypothetical protein C8T65DRAFT_139871 [Cerioporus squamosus]|nr:hypothetical protein C8T65DRAFT_139871 [Cerioporus squamosus]
MHKILAINVVKPIRRITIWYTYILLYLLLTSMQSCLPDLILHPYTVLTILHPAPRIPHTASRSLASCTLPIRISARCSGLSCITITTSLSHRHDPLSPSRTRHDPSSMLYTYYTSAWIPVISGGLPVSPLVSRCV